LRRSCAQADQVDDGRAPGRGTARPPPASPRRWSPREARER